MAFGSLWKFGEAARWSYGLGFRAEGLGLKVFGVVGFSENYGPLSVLNYITPPNI